MKTSSMIFIAALAACCAAPAQADDAKVVLFKARFTSLADARKEPADLGPNTVNFYRAVNVGEHGNESPALELRKC